MSNTKFDFYKPWRIKDLPDKFRTILEEDADFEPDATYVGRYDDYIIEVPHCPYCGTGFYKTHRCKHLVCVYDHNKDEYRDIEQSFKDHVVNVMDGLARKQPAAKSEWIAEAIADIQDGRFPNLDCLENSIKGFSSHVAFDVGGEHYIGCGYADDHLWLLCNSIPSPPDEHA